MRAPVVIIGIGGIGSDICVKVENMLPKDAPDRNAFRFVVMDTDVNTLREVRKHGFGGTIIRLSDNMTVAKCTGALEEKSLSWYQENGMFANKPMTEGAGQYRAISRLAFEYAVYEEKINELERVIRQLNELSIDDSEQQIRFYLINLVENLVHQILLAKVFFCSPVVLSSSVVQGWNRIVWMQMLMRQ